jgi:hypothetical protein
MAQWGPMTMARTVEARATRGFGGHRSVDAGGGGLPPQKRFRRRGTSLQAPREPEFSGQNDSRRFVPQSRAAAGPMAQRGPMTTSNVASRAGGGAEIVGIAEFWPSRRVISAISAISTPPPAGRTVWRNGKRREREARLSSEKTRPKSQRDFADIADRDTAPKSLWDF